MQDEIVNEVPESTGSGLPALLGSGVSRSRESGVRRLCGLSFVVVATGYCIALATVAAQRANEPAWFVRSLELAADRKEARPEVLDAPILPGSVMKIVTLVAALESHTIEADTSHLCRRVVTIGGRRYTCSHPDLKRPLTAAEALAHSCNDFFVSLAPRLPRNIVNDVRARAGLSPISAEANYAAALVGLDGPRITPRALLDVFARLTGADRERPVRMTDLARRVLLEGVRGAATYGSASELATRKISAFAKTGTAPMPGGGALGVVVALTPADKPERAVVVVAPGAAGRDATSIAGDLLAPSTSNIPAASPMLRIGFTNGDDTRVESIALEDYVARVLAGEGQPRAADAAQEALAIAVRTFALANRNRHRREGYDLCDTTHCQVLRPSTSATQRAAEATAGRLLTYQKQPATVFYSAWCGGRTELASEVWPGAIDFAFEPSQKDDACADEPGWTADISASDIERALRLAGLRGDRLRSLQVASRNASGRVTRLRAEGFTPQDVSGDDFRLAVGRVVGWRHLKSTMFQMRRTSSGYTFTGRGFGHGVGLCVIGAGNRAANGATTEEILRFYYPGLRVEQYAPTAVTTATTTTAAKPATPAPTRAADVLLALPGNEEGERGLIAGIVRRARDEIAVNTGVPVPPVIRVTVHPSVESFGRATGQPWWVSGATDQTAIDLLPVTLLQQRGQLERTVRHEVAHVLLDETLRTKPMWVREGAAFYFADPSAPPRPGKVSCPKDAEFLRPISAGAHRDAYARAEACFRRQILEGKSWRDIK
jgi:stage II sporulation protein D (peptidoglycan lytic transglycosylase)